MCEHGNEVLMDLCIPANLSHNGKTHVKRVGVDSCIAPLVRALNDVGLVTISSCCGHGRSSGSVLLLDGRRLEISDCQGTGRA
jgi:hypothetical protein